MSSFTSPYREAAAASRTTAVNAVLQYLTNRFWSSKRFSNDVVTDAGVCLWRKFVNGEYKPEFSITHFFIGIMKKIKKALERGNPKEKKTATMGQAKADRVYYGRPSDRRSPEDLAMEREEEEQRRYPTWARVIEGIIDSPGFEKYRKIAILWFYERKRPAEALDALLNDSEFVRDFSRNWPGSTLGIIWMRHTFQNVRRWITDRFEEEACRMRRAATPRMEFRTDANGHVISARRME